MLPLRTSPALLLALAALPAAADEGDGGFLGFHEAGPRYASDSGDVEFAVSGVADLEAYVFREDAPGLLDARSSFVNPRLTLFADAAIGERLSFFAQARGDRAFDPASSGLDARLDEIFLRGDVFQNDDAGLALQFGKFATPLGNWVPRHATMKSVFVRAPLPYDRMTTLADHRPPAGNGTLIARRDLDDVKQTWVPMIWGPVYHCGAMATGRAGRFEFAAALTNAAPSERPEEWVPDREDAGTLVPAVRVGWNPAPGLRAGLNWTAGAWLRHKADGLLPGGRHREDYPQKLAGLDLEYGVGHLVLFSEVFASEWKAPRLSDDPQALSYYLEAKYRLRPGLYAAARWGEILHNQITGAAGNETPWDRNARRLELGAAWFLDANLLAKFQYEINPSDGSNDQDNMLSVSTSVSF